MQHSVFKRTLLATLLAAASVCGSTWAGGVDTLSSAIADNPPAGALIAAGDSPYGEIESIMRVTQGKKIIHAVSQFHRIYAVDAGGHALGIYSIPEDPDPDVEAHHKYVLSTAYPKMAPLKVVFPGYVDMGVRADGGLRTEPWRTSENDYANKILAAAHGKKITSLVQYGQSMLATTADGELIAVVKNNGANEDERRVFAQLKEKLGNERAAEVVRGFQHFVVRTTTGKVVTTGAWYAFIDNHGDDRSNAFERLAQGKNIVSVAAAGDHTMALTDQGEVIATGDMRCETLEADAPLGAYNRCKNEISGYERLQEFMEKIGNKKVKSIAAGPYSVFAITQDGELISYGYNTNYARDNLVKEANGRKFIRVFPGAYQNLAIVESGKS